MHSITLTQDRETLQARSREQGFSQHHHRAQAFPLPLPLPRCRENLACNCYTLIARQAQRVVEEALLGAAERTLLFRERDPGRIAFCTHKQTNKLLPPKVGTLHIQGQLNSTFTLLLYYTTTIRKSTKNSATFASYLLHEKCAQS